jgi:hypothetical protein
VCLPRRSLPFSRLRRETLLFYISSCVCVEPRLISLRPFLSLELYIYKWRGSSPTFVYIRMAQRQDGRRVYNSSTTSCAHTDVVSFPTRFKYFWLAQLCLFRRSLYNLFVFFFSLIPDGSLSQAVTPKSHTLSLCFHRLVNFTRRLFFGKVTVSNLSRLTEFFKIRIEINTQLALMNAVAISGVYIGTNFSLWVHR